jgi:hypothetical protein
MLRLRGWRRGPWPGPAVDLVDVAAGFLGDVDGVEDRHAGADERAERSREAGDGGLAEDRAEDGDLELDHVDEVAPASLMRISLIMSMKTIGDEISTPYAQP